MLSLAMLNSTDIITQLYIYGVKLRMKGADRMDRFEGSKATMN